MGSRPLKKVKKDILQIVDESDEKRVSWKNTIEKHYKEGHCVSAAAQYCAHNRYN